MALPTPLRLPLAVLVLTLAGVAPARLTAAEQPSHGLNEKISTEIQKLKPLQDAKNWDGMIALLDTLTPLAGPTSYDMAFITDMKARLLAGKEQWDKSVEFEETALKLSDTYNYFDKAKVLEILDFLARVSYQQATTTKVPAAQQAALNKASTYLQRWLQTSPKPNAEMSALYPTILFQQAVADPAKVNHELLKRARVEIENILNTTLRPKEQIYFLLLAVLQQENEIGPSADLLELIVKKFPGSRNYWPVLMASYLNLAASEKEEARQREYYIRAINTMERAQALGMMSTPKDNYNLFTIYIGAGQFGKATDLLSEGLKSGKIESDPKNWITLGLYYLQINKELDAIATFQEAAKRYPTNGQVEFHLGQIFQQQEKIKEARDHYEAATKKGNLEKPHQAYMFLAYAEFELGNLEAALKVITEAENTSDGKKDPQVARLKKGISESIADRTAAREAAKAAPKKL